MNRAVVESLARAGFAVKGGVYLLLGLLALLAALGMGGRVTDPLGAIATIARSPFGRVGVGAVAVGLALYAGWRFLEAFADANRVGWNRDGTPKRLAWALSGFVYAVLALDAARLALQWGERTDSGLPPMIVASPLAPWLVTIVALGVIGYAAKEARAALAHRLSERLNLRRLTREAGPIVVEISRAGIIARAVVLAAMGIVLLRARATPQRATAGTDMSDSLRLVAALPTGPWLLIVIAAGLMAYGVYQLVHARYRRITPP